MKFWEDLKNKHLGKVSKFISWAMNIAGLVLAILSFINSNADLGWAVVLTIVVFNSTFLICISIYEALIYKKGKSIEDKITAEKKQIIETLNVDIRQKEDLTSKLVYYYKYIISALNKFNSQIYTVNWKRSQKNEHIESLVSTYTSRGEVPDSEFEKNISEMKNDIDTEYYQAMLKEFNHFLSNITNKLKYILDIALKEKGSSLETSISVKQFNRIVTDVNNTSDVIVITTFRDSQTYSQGKREIGKQEYSIGKNTDFIYCLSNPHFLKNNIVKNDKTYSNEHDGFLSHYNCTIVVPIKYSYPEQEQFYGYLTCDILNDDLNINNLLDEKMAEIMEATASIMGAYFDNMDYQWEYVLEGDFLDIIYHMKKL